MYHNRKKLTNCPSDDNEDKPACKAKKKMYKTWRIVKKNHVQIINETMHERPSIGWYEKFDNLKKNYDIFQTNDY